MSPWPPIPRQSSPTLKESKATVKCSCARFANALIETDSDPLGNGEATIAGRIVGHRTARLKACQSVVEG